MSRRHFMGSTAAASLTTLAIGAHGQAGGHETPDRGVQRQRAANGGEGDRPGQARAMTRSMRRLKVSRSSRPTPRTTQSAMGGLPNEDGVVELDAAVMHGPTHGGGSVASIRNIMHPAAVARMVMQRTRHCLIVGEGALRFARAHGFPEVELLTDDARRIWLHWKETRDPNDDWLPPPDREVAGFIRETLEPRVTGTIHCSVLDTHGDLGCTTTTSGLSWKIPGRVGDSPILGVGLFLDNEVGSAGSTGVGELNLLNLSSTLIVEGMRRGLHPKDAIMEICKTDRDASIRAREPRRPTVRTESSTGRQLLRRSARTASSPAARSIPGPGWPCTTAIRPRSSPATRSSTRRPNVNTDRSRTNYRRRCMSMPWMPRIASRWAVLSSYFSPSRQASRASVHAPQLKERAGEHEPRFPEALVEREGLAAANFRGRGIQRGQVRAGHSRQAHPRRGRIGGLSPHAAPSPDRRRGDHSRRSDRRRTTIWT